MNNQRYNGTFIAFEGPPKSGKTTLSTALANRLETNHPDKTVSLERAMLSNSPFAKTIKSLPLMSDIGYSTAFLWADTVFHTQDAVIPTVVSGGIAIQDRYDLSMVTYREMKGMVNDHLILDEYLSRGLVINPDLTVLLDPGWEAGYQRMLAGADTTNLDRDFYRDRSNYGILIDLYRKHLKRLGRHAIKLDTARLSVNDCLEILMQWRKT